MRCRPAAVPPGKLAWPVLQPVSQSNALQGGDGLRFVGDTVEVLCHHDVFDCSQIRYQVMLLKDDADKLAAETGQAVLVEAQHVFPANSQRAAAGPVKPADQVHEGTLA